MTGDEQGLIDAIRADIDSDFDRLVYADWLDEHDRPDHAELIRVQLELAKGGDKDALQPREKALIAKLRSGWPAELVRAGVGYRRGMGFVRWELPKDFEAGVSGFRQAGLPPWVVEVELEVRKRQAAGSGLDRLTGSDFAMLTSLGLCGNVPTVGGIHPALSPHLIRLRHLKLDGSPLSSEEVGDLAESPALVGLRKLVLMFGTLAGDAATRAFAAADGLPHLRELYLTSNRIGDARLRALLRAPVLRRLERLVLAGNAIRSGGAKAIAECEALTGLKHLNLKGNQIDDEGARALLDSPNLQALESVDLQWQKKITEETKKRLRERFAEKRPGG